MLSSYIHSNILNLNVKNMPWATNSCICVYTWNWNLESRSAKKSVCLLGIDLEVLTAPIFFKLLAIEKLHRRYIYIKNAVRFFITALLLFYFNWTLFFFFFDARIPNKLLGGASTMRIQSHSQMIFYVLGVAWFFLQTQLFPRRYDVSVSFLCAFFSSSSSLNSIVIYVYVFSCADVAFSARGSLKEYPSCLFLRASSRESVSTYRRNPRVLEGRSSGMVAAPRSPVPEKYGRVS